MVVDDFFLLGMLHNPTIISLQMVDVVLSPHNIDT
jgi:hypothetical protein